jgi:hypothetical protein
MKLKIKTNLAKIFSILVETPLSTIYQLIIHIQNMHPNHLE